MSAFYCDGKYAKYYDGYFVAVLHRYDGVGRYTCLVPITVARFEDCGDAASMRVAGDARCVHDGACSSSSPHYAEAER